MPGQSGPAGALDRGTLRVLTDTVARAALSGSSEQLDGALAQLRREDRAAVRAVGAPVEDSPLRAALLALAEVTAAIAAHRAALEPAVRPGTELARLLTAVAQQPGASNEELMAATGLSESAVSRTGRRRIRDGLASPTKYGRVNSWQLSELGQRAVDGLATGTLTALI